MIVLMLKKFLWNFGMDLRNAEMDSWSSREFQNFEKEIAFNALVDISLKLPNFENF